VAFYGCMYYAMMRPSEVAALTKDGCYLPDKGWGYLAFADSSPAAGRAFTDDGKVHEHRGLKGRSRGRPNIDARARRPTRRVPIPPELVALLREHIDRFGTGPDGRLFHSERGNPIQPSTWWQVWQKIRALSLSPAQAATPLLRRPYDLRHSGVTWRLNSGVPQPRLPPRRDTASKCSCASTPDA
jgi:integrase